MKNIEEKKKKSRKRVEKRIYPPMTLFRPVPKEIYTDSVLVRRLEFLNAMSEISGSTEGQELESLSRSSKNECMNYSYENSTEEEGSFDNIIT